MRTLVRGPLGAEAQPGTKHLRVSGRRVFFLDGRRRWFLKNFGEEFILSLDRLLGIVASGRCRELLTHVFYSIFVVEIAKVVVLADLDLDVVDDFFDVWILVGVR